MFSVLIDNDAVAGYKYNVYRNTLFSLLKGLLNLELSGLYCPIFRVMDPYCTELTGQAWKQAQQEVQSEPQLGVPECIEILPTGHTEAHLPQAMQLSSECQRRVSTPIRRKRG